MSQHDFNIANQSFPATRTDINDAILAIVSNSSGDTEPSTTYANQWWYETDTNILKIRNEANSGWVDVITLDASMTATASELNQLDAITRGSILYGNASGETARLAAGGAGTVLTSDGTDIAWSAGVGGGGMEFIASSGAISDGTSSVAFTGFDASKYDSYKFYFLNVVPATDDTKLMGRVSINGGSAYDSTSGNYRVGAADASGVHIHSNSGAGGSSGDTTGVSGEMTALNPANTTGFKIFTVNVGFNPSDGATNIDYNVVPTGYIANEGSAVNAIKFEMLSGNIESGEITMFGIVNS